MLKISALVSFYIWFSTEGKNSWLLLFMQKLSIYHNILLKYPVFSN